MKHSLSSAFLALFLLAVLVSLAGCGGSGSHSPAAPASNGLASFTVKWPADPAPTAAPASASGKPRLIPAASNSIVVTISSPGGTPLQSFTFVRPALSPAGYPAQTHQFSSLPVQTLTVTATAYPTQDGHGTAQAAAAQPLALTAASPSAAVSLTLLSTVKTLTLQPSGALTLFAGQKQPLFAVPQDSAGDTVLTAAATVTWSSSDAAGQFLAVDAAGNVSAKKATLGGSPITVTATYTDQDVPAPLSASATVTITPAPSGGPPNVAAYINSSGLAIGPPASGPKNFLGLADVALGSFYTADPSNTGVEVQKFKQDADGSLSLDPMFNPGNPATEGTQSVPNASAVAVDTQDSVYVVQPANPSFPGNIFKFDTQGNPPATGNPLIPRVQAVSLVVIAQNNLVVVEASGAGTQIEVYSSAGALLTPTPIITPGLQAGAPAGVTADLSGNLYVLAGNSLVKLKPADPANPAAGYAQDAAFGTGGVTTPLASVSHVAVDTRPGLVTTGNLYVTVPSSSVIEVFDKNGVDSGSLPISQSANVNLGSPKGIAIDNRVGVPSSGYIYVGNSTPAGSVSKAVQVLTPGP